MQADHWNNAGGLWPISSLTGRLGWFANHQKQYQNIMKTRTPLQVCLVGTAMDYQETLQLSREITLSTPGVQLTSVLYSDFIPKVSKIESLDGCLFVLITKHVPINSYLSDVLKMAEKRKLSLVFYPIQVDKRFNNVAISKAELVRKVEIARDRQYKKTPKVMVYLHNSSDLDYQRHMSKLYTTMLPNQQFKFYNINSVSQLKRVPENQSQVKVVIVPSNDTSVQLLYLKQRKDNVIVLLFNHLSRPSSEGSSFLVADSIQEMERHLLDLLAGSSVKTNQMSINRKDLQSPLKKNPSSTSSPKKEPKSVRFAQSAGQSSNTNPSSLSSSSLLQNNSNCIIRNVSKNKKKREVTSKQIKEVNQDIYESYHSKPGPHLSSTEHTLALSSSSPNIVPSLKSIKSLNVIKIVDAYISPCPRPTSVSSIISNTSLSHNLARLQTQDGTTQGPYPNMMPTATKARSYSADSFAGQGTNQPKVDRIDPKKHKKTVNSQSRNIVQQDIKQWRVNNAQYYRVNSLQKSQPLDSGKTSQAARLHNEYRISPTPIAVSKFGHLRAPDKAPTGKPHIISQPQFDNSSPNKPERSNAMSQDPQMLYTFSKKSNNGLQPTQDRMGSKTHNGFKSVPSSTQHLHNKKATTREQSPQEPEWSQGTSYIPINSLIGSARQKPLVLYPSYALSEFPSALQNKLARQVFAVCYHDSQSLLREVKKHYKQCLIIVMESNLQSVMFQLKSLAPDTLILVVDNGYNNQYIYNPKIRCVRSIPELVSEIEFACRS